MRCDWCQRNPAGQGGLCPTCHYLVVARQRQAILKEEADKAEELDRIAREYALRFSGIDPVLWFERYGNVR